MTQRRFLSLWFPRLGAERFLRLENDLADLPFAILQESGQAQRLSSLSRSQASLDYTLVNLCAMPKHSAPN